MSKKSKYEKKQTEFMKEMQHGIPDSHKRARLSWSKTLVLNADYRPVSVLPLQTLGWIDAVKGVMQKKYRSEAVYDDLIVRSPSIEFQVPSIVVNSFYVRHKRRIEFTDANVFLRDGFRCQYCANTFAPINLTYDHLIPRAVGGKTNWTNIVSACRRCNSSKGKKLITQWKTPLGTYGPLARPVKPTYEMLEGRVREQSIMIPDPRWVDYLGWIGPVFVNDGINPPYQASGKATEVPRDAVGF